MGTLQAWWRDLTGRHAATPARLAKRSAGQEPTGADLEIADEPAPKAPGRAGGAGFDPYSSDAGYTKPHSWERVDHD
jgi:hypothetical protein